MEELPDAPEEALDFLPQTSDPGLGLRLRRRPLRGLRQGVVRHFRLLGRIEALFHLLHMPVQVIPDDFQHTGQVSLHRLQQPQIHLAVLNEVEAVGVQLHPVLPGHAVRERKFRLRGNGHGDIGVVFRKHGAEDLIKQQRNSLTHRPIHWLGQIHTQDALVVVGAPGNAVDQHLSAMDEIVVPVHLPIRRRVHLQIRILADHPHPVDLPLVTHALGIDTAGDDIAALLAVGASAGDVVGSAPEQNPAVSGHRLHLIILAMEGEELSGQILLEDLTPKLGAQILPLSVLILGDVAGALQIPQQDLFEVRVGNVEVPLHLPGFHGELFLHADDVRPKLQGLAIGLPPQDPILGVVLAAGNGAVDAAHQIPEGVLHLALCLLHQHQLLAHLLLGHHAGAHPQAQPQYHIPHCSGIVGHHIGDGLWIRVEDAAVVRHVVLEQVLGRDDVDEALLGGAGGKVPLDLEHIAGLILHRDVLVFLDSGIPEVGGSLEIVVDALL